MEVGRYLTEETAMMRHQYDRKQAYKYLRYGRMSGDTQNIRSPDQQFANCNETIQSLAYTWLELNRYRDDGISGRLVRGRPGLVQMMKDIMSKVFEPDLIVDRDNWVTVLLARWKRIPCVSHWDGLFEAEAEYGRKKSWDFALMLPLARAVLRRFGRRYAVVTPAVRDHHVGLGFAPDRFTVLDNGVDVERFRPEVARHSVGDSLVGKVVVGFVGSFRPWHRVDEFLSAIPPIVRAHPEVVFLFVGSGPEYAKVEALAADPACAGHVRLLGRLPHEEIPSVVACFDVGVLPFTTYSCSPLKVYEYMALGKATVAPAYDSVRRVIEDGRDGLTFEPDDGADLRRVLLRLIEDAPLRRTLGEAARKKMVERFTWDHCAQRFRDACVAAGARA
jgi:glycosyltransferase involved in cell wall biosynthesis